MTHDVIAGRAMCLTEDRERERCQCMCARCWIQWLAEDIRTARKTKVLVGACICASCPDMTPLSGAR